jgi:hypothetical protein
MKSKNNDWLSKYLGVSDNELIGMIVNSTQDSLENIYKMYFSSNNTNPSDAIESRFLIGLALPCIITYPSKDLIRYDLVFRNDNLECNNFLHINYDVSSPYSSPDSSPESSPYSSPGKKAVPLVMFKSDKLDRTRVF